ncbi:centromere-associated protein E isoform X2 [Amia ocellicauda]|uniref:centromere-associated protein E isoform X2 n=1 Tax=Amia ocellicauda TaxID=2972642 RepID=UPI003463995B
MEGKMTDESAVKVCVRVRPLIQREESAAGNAESAPLYWKTDNQTVHQADGSRSFNFDRVFSVHETTDQVYQEVAKPLVDSAIKGYNGTIFAYGQTSSGKTFTMMGNKDSVGVLPLAIQDIFKTISVTSNMEFLLRVSYMEIYNETVTDLLCDSLKRKPLEIREGTNRNVYVADLTEEVVVSAKQVLEWIKKGEKNRHYGETKMNQRSSRSHTIFRMILESREKCDTPGAELQDMAVMVSHLNLVDLAGSERASQTGAEGLRLKEGCNINRSLFTLGQVIKKLTDGNPGGFTNYRDSKLTRILQNSLGGNAKTVIICTITPATIEETLSTLQFASTAKHMKNDPHVNEVLDDGALMRRYRNEIVDLKRRLEEVSSETRVQATEKEVLAQLLQEKDQLQREQEDRIKNLTMILVTSSSFVVNDMKMRNKRRVTWGGKLLRGMTSEGFNFSDRGFPEHSLKRKKADLSSVIEQDDSEMLDFDGDDTWQQTIDDLPLEMDSYMSNVSVRRSRNTPSVLSDVSSSSSSPSDSGFYSLVHVNELKEKVASLEQQLQKETQEKLEAVEKGSMLERKVMELEERVEVTVKPPAQEPVDEDIQTETYSQAAYQTYETEFRETMQLCETLVTEKEVIQAERNILKEEFDRLRKANEVLEQEKKRLQNEIAEKEELSEFKTFEEESNKLYETELMSEISSLKKEIESAGMCIENLKAELEMKSNELQKKEDWISEMQNLGGKDLMVEIQQLKHSLGDAETVNLDTKKEWAFLRSENLALKEKDVEITAKYQQMETDVQRLQSQLESEKKRFKTMQVDLQKELQIAFEENTKLTTLLDGKVPKNLIERFELEQKVAGLQKELEKSLEGERTLHAEIEALSELKHLPEKVDDLMKKICEISNELCAIQSERDALLSTKAEIDVEIRELTEAKLQAAANLIEVLSKLEKTEQKMTDLSQQHDSAQKQCLAMSEECEKLKAELENVSADKEQLLNRLEDLSLQVVNTEEQQRVTEEKLLEQEQLLKDSESTLAEREEASRHEMTHIEETIKQLETQVLTISEELKVVNSERDALLSDRRDSAQSPDAELQELRTRIKSLTEERDQLQEILEGVRAEKNQLKADLEENVEMVVQAQEELRNQQQLNSDLKTQRAERESQLEQQVIETQQDICSVKEELKLQEQLVAELKDQSTRREARLEHQINELTSELKVVNSERDALLSERRDSAQSPDAELQELRTRITLLTEQRDQLQEILEGVRAEKNQLKADLEENVEMMIETQEELRVAQEKIGEQQQTVQDLNTQVAQRKPLTEKSSIEELPNTIDLLNKVTELSEELKLVTSERDVLLSDRRDSIQSPDTNLQKLQTHITSLTEERDQLQEILEGVRAEKNQLKADLEENVEMVVQAQEELRNQQQLNSDLETQRAERESQLEQQVIETQQDICSVKEELKLQEQLVAELKDQSTEREARLEHQINELTAELKVVNSERDVLLSERRDSAQSPDAELQELQTRITSLTEERDQLQEILEGVRAEKNQLKADLEDNVEMMIETQEELRVAQEKIGEQQQTVQDLNTQVAQREPLTEKSSIEELPNTIDLLNKVTELSEELKLVTSERDALLSESRDLCNVKEELKLQEQLVVELKDQSTEREAQLEHQINELTSELKVVTSERDALLSERRNSAQSPDAELQELQTHITSLTEERDQLQEILEGVRAEKNQLKADLEENVEMVQGELCCTQEELRNQQQLNSDLETQRAERESQLEQQVVETQKEICSIKQELKLREQLVEELKDQSTEKEDRLEHQVLTISEELKMVTSERDALLSEMRDSAQSPDAELLELRSQITSLMEERDQLQEILEGVRAEKNQLKADLEENVEMAVETQSDLRCAQEELKKHQQLMSDLKIQKTEQEAHLEQKVTVLTEELKVVTSERDSLLSESRDSVQSQDTELQELRTRIASLTQETDQLKEILEAVRAEKNHLRMDLEENVEMMQVKLQQAQDELKEKLQEVEELRGLVADKELQISSIQQTQAVENQHEEKLKHAQEQLTDKQQQISDLRAQVAAKEAEVCSLKHEHLEKLLGLRQELSHTVAEHDLQRQEHESVVQERCHLEEELKAQLQETEISLQELRGELAGLVQERDQLHEGLKRLQDDIKAEKMNSESLIAEAIKEKQALSDKISSLKEEIVYLERKCELSVGKEKLSQRLEESEQEHQESLKKFQVLIDKFDSRAKNISTLLKKDVGSQNKLVHQLVSSLPRDQSKPMLTLNSDIGDKNSELVLRLRQQVMAYSGIAKWHKEHFEVLLQHSMACFEESKLHDLLISRIERSADHDSAHSTDHNERLSELLKQRDGQLREMNQILSDLEEGLANHASSQEQSPAQEELNAALRALCDNPSIDVTQLERLLQQEKTRIEQQVREASQVFQGLKARYFDQKERCQAFRVQSTEKLKEERNRSRTLFQELESGTTTTGADLVRENQRLVEKLEGSEKEIKFMQMKINELRAALSKAEDRVSDHKKATNMIQTELQELLAQVSERESSIKTLKEHLRNLEAKVQQGAAPYEEELEMLKNRVVKLELERTGLSKAHGQEVASMAATLEHKEDALRKLKETLRELQQETDTSFMVDEKAQARAPVTCGGGSGIVQSTMMLVIKSEKAKLENEVHQLKKKTTKLESLVVSLQEEVSKWKSRARKLKENSGVKASFTDMERLSEDRQVLSPHTPTKKRRLVTSEGHTLDSPKSKFFDRAESVSVACPKQFFDNSNLGTIPDLNVTADSKNDADWWSIAPQKDGVENCKTQ